MKCFLVLASLLVACGAKDLKAAESYVETWPSEQEYQAELVNSDRAPEYGVYYDNRIGRQGFGFEKRFARAAGLRMPLTANSIQHVGYRHLKGDMRM